MALILTRRIGEVVVIGDDITVRVLGVSGNHVRLGFKVPKHIPVHRQEIAERIAAENSARSEAEVVR